MQAIFAVVLRGGIPAGIITGLTFTQWFWQGVPTPVGVLILLAIFPPTIIIQFALSAVNSYTEIEISKSDG